MNIKVLDEVPPEDAEAEPEERPEEKSVDDFSESSDPVRLYLKEMGRFQLLTREGEVAVAKRIEAGQREVEEEILNSPIMLGCVIRIGEQVEASDGASTCCLSSQAWEISRTDANGTGGSHCLVGGAEEIRTAGPLCGSWRLREARSCSGVAALKPIRELLSERSAG
jgi:hypothetical protein